VTEDLRSALASGDTPAGIDVAAVRARAHRLRRRRMALATSAAAVVTALAVAVPVGLLRSGSPPPAAAPPGPVALACPDTLPDSPRNAGPGLDGALVPFPAEEALVCSYPAGSGLTGVARLRGAELQSIRRLDGRPPTGDQICTSEFGHPFVLQVGGAGRVVTLRLEPYGCALVTNGVRKVSAGREKELVRSFGDAAMKSTACPEQLDVPPAVRRDGEPPGATLLPADTRRLLVCRYQPTGERARSGKDRWNAVLSPAETTRMVAALNASPPLQPGTGCTRDAGPLLVLLAVTADGVVPAVADAGGCGVVDNGVRQVTNKALVRQLAG
jgi:hypothetical protein